MNYFGTNRNTAYQALKDACNCLFERQFSFIEKTENGDKIVHTWWVSRIAYVESLVAVELSFTPDAIKIDVCHLLKMVLTKIFHNPSFTNLSCTLNNQWITILFLFPLFQ